MHKENLPQSDYSKDLEYFRSLLSESDRGCVILLAERISDELRNMHEEYIVSKTEQSKKKIDELFSGFGPLSSFSNRIKLGHAYGLIPKDDYEDLERLRKIRNLSAHSIEDFSLDTVDNKKLIFEIGAPVRELGQKLLSSIVTQEERDAVLHRTTNTSTKLVFVCAGISLWLAVAKQRWERLKLGVRS